MARIEAFNLSKSYGAKTAVHDLSFVVEPGVVTGFLGPNGAGKSTTMRLMLGLDHGGGQTLFDGRRYGELKHPMRQVGTVLEAKAFHPTRTARNHLKLLASANGIPTSRCDEVLEHVGLSDVANKKPKTFSLGMGQRLGLAGALLGDPHTLILDEPANGLDPQGITWLRNFLKSFAEQGRSVLVSSHLLAEMAQMADALVVIGQGRLIASGPLEQFTKASSKTRIVARTPDNRRLAEALQAKGARAEPHADGSLHIIGPGQAEVGDVAFQNGLPVHELLTQEATLEEAFLEATEGALEHVAHDGATQLPPEVLGAPGGPPPGGPGAPPGGPPPGQPGAPGAPAAPAPPPAGAAPGGPPPDAAGQPPPWQQGTPSAGQPGPGQPPHQPPAPAPNQPPPGQPVQGQPPPGQPPGPPPSGPVAGAPTHAGPPSGGEEPPASRPSGGRRRATPPDTFGDDRGEA